MSPYLTLVSPPPSRTTIVHFTDATPLLYRSLFPSPPHSQPDASDNQIDNDRGHDRRQDPKASRTLSGLFLQIRTYHAPPEINLHHRLLVRGRVLGFRAAGELVLNDACIELDRWDPVRCQGKPIVRNRNQAGDRGNSGARRHAKRHVGDGQLIELTQGELTSEKTHSP